MGYSPLQIAIRESVAWDQGLRSIFEAFTSAIKRPRLNMGCEYGLQWSNGMKEVMETNKESIGVYDEVTGLYPFMLAAAGVSSDVNVIFETMRITQNTF